jgi:fructose-specific phosphotransferase system IIC component
MARGGTATAGLRAAHAKSIKGLAWASFVIAIADGALIPNTFVGDWTRKVFGWLPWGPVIPIIVLIVGVVATFLDCYLDLEPNQVAVYSALMLPTIASTIHGGLADWVRELSQTVLDAIDQWLFQAAPRGLGSSALAIAIALAVTLMSDRVVKKSRRG